MSPYYTIITHSWEYGTLASFNVAGWTMGLPYSNCFSDERAGSRSVARTVMEQTFAATSIVAASPTLQIL